MQGCGRPISQSVIEYTRSTTVPKKKEAKTLHSAGKKTHRNTQPQTVIATRKPGPPYPYSTPTVVCFNHSINQSINQSIDCRRVRPVRSVMIPTHQRPYGPFYKISTPAHPFIHSFTHSSHSKVIPLCPRTRRIPLPLPISNQEPISNQSRMHQRRYPARWNKKMEINKVSCPHERCTQPDIYLSIPSQTDRPTCLLDAGRWLFMWLVIDREIER